MKVLKIAILIILSFVLKTDAQHFNADTSASLIKTERVLIDLIEAAVALDRHDTNIFDRETTFINNLVSTLKSKKTFSYPFNGLINPRDSSSNRSITLIYSNDSLLRIFYWLSPSTGTMFHIPAIIQARTKNGNEIVKSSEEDISTGDFGGDMFYKGIYRLRNTSRQLYIAIGGGRASSSLPFEAIQIFEILSTAITDTAAIILNNKKRMATILIDREATLYKDKPQHIPQIVYDPKKQIIIFPKMDEYDEKYSGETWTGKMVKLQFDGELFRPIK